MSAKKPKISDKRVATKRKKCDICVFLAERNVIFVYHEDKEMMVYVNEQIKLQYVNHANKRRKYLSRIEMSNASTKKRRESIFHEQYVVRKN